MTTVATPVTFMLNGAEVRASAEHPHVLAALREELGITSPKDGCAPSGQCGCCTVLLDGKATIACQLSMEKVAGRTVTTLEGFDPAERDRLARAFAATGALQCGFCTPGIVVRTKSLLDQKGAGLDRATIESRLGAHLCRCTGYVKIIDAIELLASGAPIPEPALPGGIGKEGAKYESSKLALGDRGFIDDLSIYGMLHGALRLTDHARADVIRIDTEAARAIPGVVAIFTAADVPGELKVGLIHKDWPVFIPEGGRTSYAGDVLAIVVAEDVATARRAADAVEVEYRRACRRSPIRWRLSSIDRGRRLGSLRQRPVDLQVQAGRCRRRPGIERPHPARGVPDPAGGARLSRTRVDPGDPQRRRNDLCLLGRTGSVGRPRPDRRRCSASRSRPSPSNSYRTAGPSGARRTSAIRRRPPSPRSCSTARSSARSPATSRI